MFNNKIHANENSFKKMLSDIYQIESRKRIKKIPERFFFEGVRMCSSFFDQELIALNFVPKFL